MIKQGQVYQRDFQPGIAGCRWEIKCIDNDRVFILINNLAYGNIPYDHIPSNLSGLYKDELISLSLKEAQDYFSQITQAQNHKLIKT